MTFYFKQFPKIEYNEKTCINIMHAFKISEISKSFKTLYLDYEIESTETRPEHVAQSYYGDGELDWVILLTNNLVDPYFQWPMSQNLFNKYIKQKYNTTANANSSISYYYFNYDDDIKLSISEFNNLSSTLRKYWQPVFKNNTFIIHYEKSKLDIKLNSIGFQELTTEERQYFIAKTIYDEEFEKNQNRRFIKIINRKYLPDFLREMKSLINDIK